MTTSSTVMAFFLKKLQIVFQFNILNEFYIKKRRINILGVFFIRIFLFHNPKIISDLASVLLPVNLLRIRFQCLSG